MAEESHVRMLLVDESVFRLNPPDDTHNRRVAEFLNDASSSFAIFYATREKPLRKAVQKMEKAGIFELVDGNMLNITEWQTFRNSEVDVFFSDNVSSENPVKARCAKTTEIATGKGSFESFMKLYGKTIESGPPKLVVTEALAKIGVSDSVLPQTDSKRQSTAERDLKDLERIYGDPMEVWKKIKSQHAVRSILAEFNRHARNDTGMPVGSLETKLFCYFSILALGRPEEKEMLEKYPDAIRKIINQDVPKSQCEAKLENALKKIGDMVKTLPRRDDDEWALTA